MIDLETVARIRQLHHAEHWPVGTIAAELGLHHETVERALEAQPRGAPYLRPSKLDPYLEFMRETLTRYPHLRSTRIWRMLQERGYSGKERQVRRKVAELRPRPREAFLRRRTFPGEEGQVDWASFGHVMIGAARRALSAFVMTLTYSRMLYLEFFFDQTLENFLRGHVHAFADLGGVPRQVLHDNLRAAVIERHGEAVRFNPRLLELCAHYHFVPRACAVRRGNEKGGVERSIRYIRDSFFAARPFTTLEDFNRQARVWRDQVALARRWPGDDRQSVADAFVQEAPRLLPLPTHPFDTDLLVPVRSQKTLYVRFDLNDYTIPPDRVGQQLSLLASDVSVRILAGTHEVARHRRSYDRHQRVEDHAHIEALLAEKQRARGSTPCARLLSAVPAAEAFLDAGFQRGESVALMTHKLLLLLDDYGAQELRLAVHETLDKQTPRTTSVAYVLAKRRRQTQRPALLPVDLSRRPDLQHLYVNPHPSESYDELSRTATPADEDDDQHD